MISKVAKYLGMLVAFTIPISQMVSSRILIVLVILILFAEFWKFKLQELAKRSWDLILYFLVLLLGLLYSSEHVIGAHQIETNLSLIGFSILFHLNFKAGWNLSSYLISFFTGVLIASFICLIKALVYYFSSGDISFFFFEKLTEVLGIDSTYFGYYLIFGITCGLYSLYYQQISFSKWLVFSVVILFFFMLILIANTIAYVSLLLVISFFILKFLADNQKTNQQAIVAYLSVCLLLALFLVSHFKLVSPVGENYWERFVLWQAALKATPNILFGVGTGDYNIVLNEYYSSHGMVEFSVSNFNAHNQFIQTLLSNGIIGLIALLIMMIRPLFLSVKYENPLGILVFFSFFIYGMTEVFLGRYQGVVFFGLLHQIFISHYASRAKLSVKEN